MLFIFFFKILLASSLFSTLIELSEPDENREVFLVKCGVLGRAIIIGCFIYTFAGLMYFPYMPFQVPFLTVVDSHIEFGERVEITEDSLTDLVPLDYVDTVEVQNKAELTKEMEVEITDLVFEYLDSLMLTLDN